MIAGALEIQMYADIARLTADMASAKSLIGKTTADIEAFAGKASKALGLIGVALGAGASLSAVKDFVEETVKATAALERMAKTTGASVEALSALRTAARLTNTDFGSVESALIKMTKGMTGAEDQTKGFGGALAYLGLSSRDANGNLKSTDAMFLEIATSLDRYADGAGKTALAQALLGKQGAQMLPVLKDLALAGEFNAKVTADQAEQADSLERNLTRLSLMKKQVAKQIVMEFIPAMDDLVITFIRAQKESDGLRATLGRLVADGSIKTWADSVAMFIAKGVDTFLKGMVDIQVAISQVKVSMLSFQEFSLRAATGGVDNPLSKAYAKELAAEEIYLSTLKGNADKARLYYQILLGQQQGARAEGGNVGIIDQINNALGGTKKPQANPLLAGVDAAKKAADEIAKYNQKMRDLDNKGWIAKIEADIAAYEEEQAALLKIDEERLAERQRMLDLDNQGWVAYIEAQTTAYEDELTAIGKLTKSNIELSDEAKKALHDYLDPAKPKAFGDALTSSFGAAGSALLKLINALQDYGQKEAEIAKQRADNAKINDPVIRAQNEIALARASATAQINAYGNMAAAAKGFFDAGSTGYKALEAAERVFRAFELASAIQNMLAKSGLLAEFTSLFVASKAAETAATVASVAPDVAASLAKGEAAAAVGVANQAQGDPYTAWARMAAMAAVMVGLGFAVSGAFGSSGSSGESAAQRQAAQGTGTVLGDAAAKSASLLNAMKEVERIDQVGLVYTHDMLIALQSIQSSMAGLAAIVYRTTGVTTGSGFDVNTGVVKNQGDPIFNALGLPNFGSSLPIIGGLIGALQGLWGKTTTAITDSGLMVAGTIRDLAAGKGVSQYANVHTDSSSFFGLVHSSSDNTVTQGVDPALARQFGTIFQNITDTIEAAARSLGLWFPSLSQDIQNFVIDIGKISLDGLKGQELQDALNAVFSKAADQLAEFVFPLAAFAQFQKAGEGFYETMIRIASENELVAQTFAAFGWTMNQIGIDAVAARVHMVELAGGIDNFSKITQDYYTKFYSGAEQHSQMWSTLNAEFVHLGITMPTTLAGFRGLVDSIGTATPEAQALTIQLLQLAPSFASWADSVAGLDGKLHTLEETQQQHNSLQEQMDLLIGVRTQRQIDNEHRLAEAIDDTSLRMTQLLIAQENLNAVNAEAHDWQTKLDILQGRVTQEQIDRAAQWEAALSAANRAIMEQVWAEEDLQKAAAAAKVTAGLQSQLDVLTGKISQKDVDRANQWLAAASETDRALLVQIFRQQDVAQAAADMAAALDKLNQSAGISTSQITTLIRDVLTGKSTGGELGAQLTDMLIGGVKNAIAGQAAQQVTDIINTNLMQPIMTAILNGSSVTAALEATLTQANIDAMVASATAAVETMAAVFNDPAFQSAMTLFQNAINRVVDTVVQGVGAMNSVEGAYNAGQGLPGQIWISTGGNFGYWAYPPGYVPPDTGGAGGSDPVLAERIRLQDQLDQLTMTYTQLLEKQRNALYESNRGLFDQIHAAEVAKSQRELDIQLLEATGQAEEALAMRRADILAGMDSSLWATQQAIWDALDAQKLQQATDNWTKTLDAWLNSNALSSALSPLTAQQQLVEAQRQYDIAKAGHDAGALTQAADALLTADKAVEGFGGGYSALYESVRAEISQLAHPADVPTAGETAIVSNIIQLRTDLADTKEVLARLLERQIDQSIDNTVTLENAVLTGTGSVATATSDAIAVNEKR